MQSFFHINFISFLLLCTAAVVVVKVSKSPLITSTVNELFHNSLGIKLLGLTLRTLLIPFALLSFAAYLQANFIQFGLDQLNETSSRSKVHYLVGISYRINTIGSVSHSTMWQTKTCCTKIYFLFAFYYHFIFHPSHDNDMGASMVLYQYWAGKSLQKFNYPSDQ